MTARPELFQGAIEDRYVGAFLDAGTYGAEEGPSRADQIASAIEVLRVAALSSYENRPISSGALLLDALEDPCKHAAPPESPLPYSQWLTTVKAFYRLCNGLQTLYLVANDGRVLSTVDVERWANELRGTTRLLVPCARSYTSHARSTQGNRHVCVVLSPSHEIKVFAEGAQVFAFRNAHWHLLDLEAHYEDWATSVGNRAVAERLFQAALDLSDARQGALFVVLREPDQALPQLVAPGERMIRRDPRQTETNAARRPQLLTLLGGADVLALDLNVLEALASLDGATVFDAEGRVLAAGAILRHPPGAADGAERVEGARTTAALTASRFGPVLKVSEDGLISFFDGNRHWDI
jgi:DNA integrity scanning protein DisA with diadenylate cyclase activity